MLCPVCNRECNGVKGRTRHITLTKNEQHQNLTRIQEEMVRKCFVGGGKIDDLLSSENFLFGRDWIRAFSRRTFNVKWNNNKEVRLQNYICKKCGKDFETYPSKYRKIPIYCSWECFEADTRKIGYKCHACGEDFKAHKKSDGTDRHFCSQKCYNHQNGVSETKTLDIIDTILGEKSLRNKKYSWMRSPKNRPLEIDGYYPEHNFAVEFQGQQHYVCSSLFGEDFAYRQTCDKIKREAIKSKGILFLEIKYDEPLTEEHLIRRIEEVI